jgi:CubicO group peptidase (beta-lactamase class C family)
MKPMTRRRALKTAILWSAGCTTGFANTAAEWTQLPASKDISDRERAQMTSVAQAFAERYDVPGLSVAIARKGRLVYDQSLGVADRERSETLTLNHRFRIASVSKPITATAIFLLIQDGKLALSHKVFGQGAVLGTRFGRRPYGRYVEDITIEHLLTHTGGGWRNDGSDPMFKHPEMSHADLISWTLDSIPLQNPPGQSYAYSNFGYCVLGRVIEAIGGRPYEQIVRQRVLEKCGLRGLAIAGNTLADRAQLEVRYYGQAGENPYNMNVRRMDSHGGWLATARDLTVFATYVDGFDSPADILESRGVRRMTTPSAASQNYACGWSVNTSNNWWHGGSLPGTTTILVRTASGMCWAALTNTRRPSSDMGTALDNMVWKMVRQVSDWHL